MPIKFNSIPERANEGCENSSEIKNIYNIYNIYLNMRMQQDLHAEVPHEDLKAGDLLLFDNHRVAHAGLNSEKSKDNNYFVPSRGREFLAFDVFEQKQTPTHKVEETETVDKIFAHAKEARAK